MFGKFRIRLLILIAALIIIVQGLTILAVVVVTAHESERHAMTELQTGLGLVHNVLRYQGAREQRGLTGLANDDRLAALVLKRDTAGLRAYLGTHIKLIGARVAVVFSADGQLIMSTDERIDARVADAMAGYVANNPDELDRSFVSLGNQALQFAFVPLRTDGRSGTAWSAASAAWVGVATPLDATFVARMRNDFRLDTLVWASDSRSAALSAATEAGEDLTVAQSLPTAWGRVVIVLRKAKSEVLAPSYWLGYTMLAISALAVFAGLLLAMFLGRAAARPIDQLVRAAGRIEQGDYAEPVHVRGAVEFERLGNSLNAMQTRIAEREQRIQHQASHDHLTGLMNLPASLRQLGLHLQHAAQVAVILIDIRRFRDVNASLGHVVGNRLLIELARRLAGLVSDPASVGRISGDEFMVLLPGAGIVEARALVERVVNDCRGGLTVGNHTLKFDLRIGFCAAPEHGTTANELLFHADIAREEARDSGLNVKAYQPGHDEGYRRRLALLEELRTAIATDQLTVVYQPQVFTSSRRIKSFEALARWSHPQLGWIPPSEFIPLAEQSGAIAELTRWVLRKAIAQLADWRRLGLHVDIAVNLCATDLSDKELPGELLALLEQHQVRADQLVIEMTESTVLRDPESAKRVMQRLRASGVRFSIDDYGTGYSSLAQLQRLPLDELKIDRSFISDLDQSPGNEAIVRSTIELGHTLGLKVVAEGIETGEVWARLLMLGCDYGQGYFVSRPMPADQVVAWTTDMNARLAAAVSDTAQVRALSDGSRIARYDAVG